MEFQAPTVDRCVQHARSVQEQHKEWQESDATAIGVILAYAECLPPSEVERVVRQVEILGRRLDELAQHRSFFNLLATTLRTYEGGLSTSRLLHRFWVEVTEAVAREKRIFETYWPLAFAMWWRE